MGILNSTILLLKKKFELEKVNARLKLNIKSEKLFFSLPNKIELLIAASNAAIDLITKSILTTGYEKEDIKNFLRTDKTAKNILKFTLNDLDNDNLSDLLLECYNENAEKISYNLSEDNSVDDILKNVNNINDIDRKIDKNKIKKLFNKINSANEIVAGSYVAYNIIKIKSYKHLLQHIIYMIKDLLTKTIHPSEYRTKYIQKLIRNIYGLLHDEYKGLKGNTKKEYENILDALKQLDSILIAITLVTTIYIKNRKILSKKSRQAVKEIISDNLCASDLSEFEPFDVSVNKSPFKIVLDCPNSVDDVLVPHVPIEEKLKNISCEVVQTTEDLIEAKAKEDLATIAVIRNSKSDKLECIVTNDAFVNTKTRIANIRDIHLYSPIEGYVQDIKDNEIIIRDIKDPEQDYLSELINLMNKKYERLNYVKSFLKDYYLGTFYPVMLSISIIDDSSTLNTSLGIEPKYKDLRKEYFNFNDTYEKAVKQITGKDNVEIHAKNETLNKIKEDLDKYEEIFYNNLKLLGQKSINIAKSTKALEKEYELFEYYSLELGGTFNAIDKPNELEIEFRDMINEYIRKRYVTDGYKKKKLEKRIEDLIAEIEKGSTSGNWFVKLLEKYLLKKSMDDVKKWLTDLAAENKKLEETEKIALINKTIFLFKLYLDIDTIVQKYSILQKETTSKKETNKEGNEILNFTSNLWKEYYSLYDDIENIEKTIDDISSLTTYSIIDYNGREARLYSLADDQKCESKDVDPYLNPKSQYGYNDIQYWLKYCSYATLMSVINPATAWSTGWITPTPIMFPVVYIPIKAVNTKYGFVVIGLSVCGIYPFPWVLLANLGTNYTLPFFDPTTILKNEISVLKKEISEQLINLKKATIKPLLEQTKKDIENTQVEIEKYKNEISQNKEAKPDKFENTNNGVKIKLNYYKEYEKWLEISAQLNKLLLTSKIKKWKYEQKYDTLKDAYDFGKSLKGITNALEKTEKFINDKLSFLEERVNNLSKVTAALPIALAPETANFAITLKNTKPIINIADELDDNVNIDVLDKFIEKFKLKNSDMLSANYENKLWNSMVNFNRYKSLLSASMITFIRKDPFPKYELLKPTNIPWLSFLINDFTKVGAQSYGFPNQAPIPI